jgi:hypothetical protein
MTKDDLTNQAAKLALAPGQHFERDVGEPLRETERHVPALVLVAPRPSRCAQRSEPRVRPDARKGVWWKRGGERR